MATKLKSKKKKDSGLGSNEKIKNYYSIFSQKREDTFDVIRKNLQTKNNEVMQKLQSPSVKEHEKLVVLRDLLHEALPNFKNKESKKLYDARLDEAIENNLIDAEVEQIAKDIWEELENLFLNGNYNSVIRKCNELLASSSDVELYRYLSKSYYFTDKVEDALATVNKCVEIHPQNIPALKMAARAYNDFTGDLNKSQELVNQMCAIDPNSTDVFSEQIFIYLCMENQERAFALIDEYLEKNPSDDNFRRNCAIDIINYSYRLYKPTQTEGGLISVLTEKVDYENCLSLAEKAYSICTESFVAKNLDDVKKFGITEFNEDNRESLKWMKIGVATYGITAIAMLIMTFAGMGIDAFIAFLFAAALTAGLVYCTKGLKEVSNRPYWQLCKYYLTGEREPKEKKFIMIGNILSGLIKFIWKASWGIAKFGIRLGLGG